MMAILSAFCPSLENYLLMMPIVTNILLIILSFSTVISTGPIGGAPLPLIRVAPLMINCEKGPSDELLMDSCALIKKKQWMMMN